MYCRVYVYFMHVYVLMCMCMYVNIDVYEGSEGLFRGCLVFFWYGVTRGLKGTGIS